MTSLHLRTVTEKLRRVFLLFFCAILLLFPCTQVNSATNNQPAVDNEKSQRFITIDFDNVDIRLFIKYISELTGKNFIIDKTVKGTVSIISPTKISEKEAYHVFESVLSVNGFTTVPAGAMIKIMPAVRARTENIDTLHHGYSSSPEDKIVTQLIPLVHTTPLEMKKVLAPLVSKTSVVIAHTQSGMLIVTDTLSNIQKLLSIIESLDVDYSSDELEVIPLEYATASKMATTINTIFQRSSTPKKGAITSSGIKIVPYDRINALILLAGPGDTVRVKRLIAMLDTESEQDEGNIQVVYLQHARAKELSAVLTNLSGAKAATGKGPSRVPSISSSVKIMPDEETNALIITASRSEFKVLSNVIKKLDIPRRMVYLEALIMEVDTDTNFTVGVRWLGAGSFSDGDGALLGGWGGSGKFGAGDAVGDGLSIGQGFSLGVLKKGIEIGGMTFPSIAAVLNAYKNDRSINIIATPQILTTDNKKAEISVGENRPYQTSKSEGNNSNTTGYNTYEYKDVATKLSITPQINQANTLRLEIATEVSRFNAAATGATTERPVTYKRSTNSTVLVQDGQTIVIGGMIGHNATETEWKVPLLGDIPLIGWLFKTSGTGHVKTNMFIFITPHIIKNPADIAHVTLTKEDQIGNVMPQVKEELHRQVNLDHAMGLSDVGFQKMQKGQYGEARNYFDEALEINPKSAYALMNLGTICEREGKPKEAVKYYQQVITNGLDPKTGMKKDAGPMGMKIMNMCQDNIDRLGNTQKQWPNIDE